VLSLEGARPRANTPDEEIEEYVCAENNQKRRLRDTGDAWQLLEDAPGAIDSPRFSKGQVALALGGGSGLGPCVCADTVGAFPQTAAECGASSISDRRTEALKRRSLR